MVLVLLERVFDNGIGTLERVFENGIGTFGAFPTMVAKQKVID
jgi:hypothetical protein